MVLVKSLIMILFLEIAPLSRGAFFLAGTWLTNRYDFRLSDADLAGSTWMPQQPSPAVSVRESIATALKIVAPLTTSATLNIDFDEASLVPVGEKNTFLYLIHFRSTDASVQELFVPVLFNGKTPKPLISASSNLVVKFAPLERKQFVNHYNGRRFSFSLSPDLLSKSLWSNDQSNPPLSPRAATKRAQTALINCVPESVDWPLSGVKLRCFEGEQFFYLISFTFPLDSKKAGFGVRDAPYFSIPVYLDGKVPSPEVSRISD
jgi:hypothetical protein